MSPSSKQMRITSRNLLVYVTGNRLRKRTETRKFQRAEAGCGNKLKRSKFSVRKRDAFFQCVAYIFIT